VPYSFNYLLNKLHLEHQEQKSIISFFRMLISQLAQLNDGGKLALKDILQMRRPLLGGEVIGK
jgi:hypothetical protein